ncbi:ABC transporter substrate-binding protein [Tianweitania sediminis]|uniref:ABC transporter substrate-binding protein n=1 Tax=Tianweitania sediminis TaxID=1502156 RepID=A0A8J7R9I9_9HYPH|nr:ABC transporter substrate-binding protein [Tianweitania sediminis]MBP0441340.1 ABC transporter substrate-binding protein [Tianweitania sediminis]
MRLFKTSTRLAAGIALAAFMSSAAFAQEVINIGFTGPLSGGAALYGQNTLTGLQMAAAEINKNGGIEVGGEKYTFEIVALDDKYAPSEAAVNAKRLATQQNAPVIFVPHSGGAYALQEFNEQDGFILGAYTSVPEMTERGNTLTLRIPPSFAGYIDTFVKTTMEKSGKKLAMIGGDHEYAKAWASLFKPAWEEAGGEVVAENPMSYNKDTDFYSGVSSALSANPDVLFVGGASEPTALVMRTARELGFQGGFVVMDQAKLDEINRVINDMSQLNGAIGVMPLSSDTREGAKAFVERFKAENNGKTPGSETSYMYTALNAVAEAMKLAGTVEDPKAIHAKLSEAYGSLPSERNPASIDSVDEKGGTNARIVVGYVQDGEIMPIEAASQ